VIGHINEVVGMRGMKVLLDSFLEGTKKLGNWTPNADQPMRKTCVCKMKSSRTNTGIIDIFTLLTNVSGYLFLRGESLIDS
jgi:hypothetical protein